MSRAAAIPAVFLLVLTGCTPGDVAPRDSLDDVSFWSAPWPSDERLTGDGRPDMSGFPQPPDTELFGDYLAAYGELDGYSLNAPAFFGFSGALKKSSFPEPDETLDKRSAVQWVDIDPDSPDYGRRFPVELEFRFNAFTHSDENLLVVRPPLGLPLRSATTYAVIVLNKLKDGSGLLLQTSPELERKLEERIPPFDLLDDYLSDGAVKPPSRSKLSVATVFTTQDVFSDTDAVAETVLADPIYPEFVEAIEGWPEELREPQTPPPLVDFIHGIYLAQNYQHGDPPYGSEGGGFVFEDGAPQPGLLEEVAWLLSVPFGDPPDGGWPLCIYLHGTGGDRGSFARAGPNRPSTLLARRGIAVLGIDQPLHGHRTYGNYNVELMSFNLTNPSSARTLFRQGAIDILSALEFARRHMTDGGPLTALFPNAAINPDRIVYLGHSQGGLTGAIMLGLPNDVGTAVLSGTGGGISTTILERKDITDFEQIFRNAAAIPETEPFDLFHPVLAVIQGIVDVTDPLSWGPRWWDNPEGAGGILLLQGRRDQATPATSSDALAAGARLPIIQPVVQDIPELDLQGIEPIDPPFSDNLLQPDGTVRTGGLHQNGTQGHFLLFDNDDAAKRSADFLRSGTNQTPTIR